MIRVKQVGRNGVLHWLPGAHAYRALCGVVDAQGDWMPVRDAATVFWDTCKRCTAIKAKSESPTP